jgi:hypothetical protein
MIASMIFMLSLVKFFEAVLKEMAKFDQRA